MNGIVEKFLISDNVYNLSAKKSVSNVDNSVT